jgi:hypothetical protein
MTNTNQTLLAAKAEKNGEFFILKNEVSQEMPHYISHLNGKKVYIPNTKMTEEYAQCDAFARFFSSSSMMNKFGIKELSYSYYDCVGNFVLVTIHSNGVTREVFNASDDDSRLFYVFKQIDKVDVVIANPEGSKVGEMFRYIYLSKKDYILSVNKMFIANAICFNALINGYVKFGHTTPKNFYDVKNNKIAHPTAMWITSFDTGYTPKFISTYYDMNSYAYNHYDNYDAIDVECIKMIPMDCDCVMGVPVTFAPFLNLNQFEIVGLTSSSVKFTNGYMSKNLGTTHAIINNKDICARLLIRFRR